MEKEKKEKVYFGKKESEIDPSLLAEIKKTDKRDVFVSVIIVFCLLFNILTILSIKTKISETIFIVIEAILLAIYIVIFALFIVDIVKLSKLKKLLSGEKKDKSQEDNKGKGEENSVAQNEGEKPLK